MKQMPLFRIILLLILIMLFLFNTAAMGISAKDQEKSDAKKLQEFGEQLLKDNPELASKSNLERAKAGFEAYLKELSRANAGVSNDFYGRGSDLFADERATFTCSAHTKNLNDIFIGMGISENDIGFKEVEVSSDKWSFFNPLNVNRNHGALLIRDNDGKLFVFDAWSHATMRDTWSPFDTLYEGGETSPFNGVEETEWNRQMRDEGYDIFNDPILPPQVQAEETGSQSPSVKQDPSPKPTRVKRSCPPNTTTYHERTGMCLPNEPCKGNQIWNDEKYVCECKWNENADKSGNCIPIPCTGGKIWNTETRNCECQEGYSEDGSGNCVKTCSDGSFPDPGSGECPVEPAACSGMIQGLSSVEIFGVVVNYDAGDRLYHAVKDGDTIVFDPCTYLIRDETTGEERQVSESDILYPQNEPSTTVPTNPPTRTPTVSPTVTPAPTSTLPVDPEFGPMHGDGCYYKDGKPVLCRCWMECPECVPCSAAYREEQNIIVPDDCNPGTYWEDGACYPDTLINQPAEETSAVSQIPPSKTCSDGTAPDPDTGECPVATPDTPVVTIRGITFTYHPEDGEYHGTFQEESGEVHELRYDAKTLFVHCITCGSEEYISESEVTKIK